MEVKQEPEQTEQTQQTPEVDNADVDNTPANSASNSLNVEEEIKKLNDRIDNVLMKITLNNEPVEQIVDEKQDDELDF